MPIINLILGFQFPGPLYVENTPTIFGIYAHYIWHICPLYLVYTPTIFGTYAHYIWYICPLLRPLARPLYFPTCPLLRPLARPLYVAYTPTICAHYKCLIFAMKHALCHHLRVQGNDHTRNICRSGHRCGHRYAHRCGHLFGDRRGFIIYCCCCSLGFCAPCIASASVASSSA